MKTKPRCVTIDSDLFTEGKIPKWDAATHRFIAVDIVVDPPASASATGTKGQIAFDSSYIYTCIATDTWMRAAITTW